MVLVVVAFHSDNMSQVADTPCKMTKEKRQSAQKPMRTSQREKGRRAFIDNNRGDGVFLFLPSVRPSVCMCKSDGDEREEKFGERQGDDLANTRAQALTPFRIHDKPKAHLPTALSLLPSNKTDGGGGCILFLIPALLIQRRSANVRRQLLRENFMDLFKQDTHLLSSKQLDPMMQVGNTTNYDPHTGTRSKERERERAETRARLDRNRGDF